MKLFTATFITLLIWNVSVSAQDRYETIAISNDLLLIKLSENAYVHVSYSELPEFGRFPSNGLLLINDGEAFLFDSPVNNEQTEELVSWIADSLKVKLIGFVPNHWHEDCMGGIAYLHSIGVKSYAHQMTIDLAKSKNLPLPQNGFKEPTILKLGDIEIHCEFLGAAHSLDNIVVWIPSEEILFPGCIAKAVQSTGLGHTADGDLTEYPKTLDKILNKYKTAKIVITGHGPIGGMELVEHTKMLCDKVAK